MSAVDTRSLTERLVRVRKGAALNRNLKREQKDRVLLNLAEKLIKNEKRILEANRLDVEALPSTTTAAFRDRLVLNPKRITLMAESLKQVASLPDPVAVESDRQTLANGLQLRRVSSPLGVIFMIFESRPNVVTEAFSLAFKAGNAVILRGGKEAKHSAHLLFDLISDSFAEAGLSDEGLWGLTDSNREIAHFLLKQKQFIDIVVPRGSESLIHFVVEESRIPIIKNDRGLCHAYVDENADLKMAEEIVVNAKVSRPAACNSLETVLIHKAVAESLLPALYDRMKSSDVSWYGCPETLRILGARPKLSAATDKNYDTEYTDFILNSRVVESYEQALEHIERYSSRHSDCIITRDEKRARDFQERVDSAAVYWNASTRFTDGFEFGLGGELGISTQKLHVRGPVGLKELTSSRWLIDGTGQVRP